MNYNPEPYLDAEPPFDENGDKYALASYEVVSGKPECTHTETHEEATRPGPKGDFVVFVVCSQCGMTQNTSLDRVL